MSEQWEPREPDWDCINDPDLYFDEEPWPDAFRDSDGRIISIDCPNCGAPRSVDTHSGLADPCAWCSDDEIDVYDDRQVP